MNPAPWSDGSGPQQAERSGGALILLVRKYPDTLDRLRRWRRLTRQGLCRFRWSEKTTTPSRGLENVSDRLANIGYIFPPVSWAIFANAQPSWAHLVGALQSYPINIAPTILPKKIEDFREAHACVRFNL